MEIIVWQKNVATYSEYLVEVDFLRIYTHINIYCKSISFSFELFEAFRLKLLLAWQYAWVLLLSDTFLFCAWKPRELRNRSVFSFLSLSSSFFLHSCSFCSYVIYACLHTVSIKSLFFSVTVIFTSSLDALTMQTHSSFNHMYSFLPSPQLSVATEEFMGTWGQSTNPLCLVVMPD